MYKKRNGHLRTNDIEPMDYRQWDYNSKHRKEIVYMGYKKYYALAYKKQNVFLHD